MRADLHVHTRFSDGAHSPAEIAEMAKAAGLEALSMTDHDSLEGEEEKRRESTLRGIFYLSGWEVSAYSQTDKVHILGYGCKRNGAYFRFLEERKQGALVRAEDALRKANACFGLHVSIEEAEEFHTQKCAPLHTMHVVRAVARRLGTDPAETYRNYFSVGKAAYSALCRPTPEYAIETIHACGGISSLAHPGRLHKTANEREALLLRLIGHGLDGIECYYSTHTARETEYFQEFAKRYHLFVTGGSDYHAEGYARTVGKPEFSLGEELLKALGY